MIMELIKLEKYNQDKTVADLDTVLKFMYDNKEHCNALSTVMSSVRRLSWI